MSETTGQHMRRMGETSISLRQLIGAAVLASIPTLFGTGLAMWRSQGILEQKVEALEKDLANQRAWLRRVSSRVNGSSETP